MSVTRKYTTRRLAIVEAIVEVLKTINGTGTFVSDVSQNVHPRLKYWDEIEEFPSLCVNAGLENRTYQGGGYKDRFLNIKVTCYVNDEDPVGALEALMEDVETCLENNSRLKYITRSGQEGYTQSITILSLDTDEGVMAPLGIGEILCEIRY